MTQTLNQSVAVKKELSRKVKFSIYWSIYLYILILIYLHFIDSKTFYFTEFKPTQRPVVVMI